MKEKKNLGLFKLQSGDRLAGFFNVKTFFSASKMLSLSFSDLTNNKDSPLLVLHLQRPCGSNGLIEDEYNNGDNSRLPSLPTFK